MPYCWKCGAEVKEGDKFCPRCGTPSTEEARREGEREREYPKWWD